MILNHDWIINDSSNLETSFGFQFGEMGNSRLDYAGGSNPSPAYYQDLPSYYLADSNGPDYEGAYIAQENFVGDGQINWNRIYDANNTNSLANLNAAYVLYEDRVDDKQLTINSTYTNEISENIKISTSINHVNLVSENFAEISDMLGGSSYTNIDSFDNLDYNLLSPNSIVSLGDKFKYHYKMNVQETSLFSMIDFSYNKLDFYLAGNLTNTIYQRDGVFENEANIGNSAGKGNEVTFDGFGVKAGLTYKFSGKHIIDFNSAYLQKAPSIRNTFTNSRVNHNIVGSDANGLINNTPITEEKIMSFDANYILEHLYLLEELPDFILRLKMLMKYHFIMLMAW